MGINASTMKSITDPINHLVDNCGKSNCHSKCGNCFEVDIENQVRLLPVEPFTLPRSRDSNDSMDSNITKTVEHHAVTDT